jgi:hypothetical protein
MREPPRRRITVKKRPVVAAVAAATEEEDREQWVLLSDDHLSGEAYLGDVGDINTEGVSRTLTNQEVRADLARWIEPITTEVHQLSVVKEAIYRMSAVEAKQFMREHPGAILYPAKGVFVAKASGKLRARGVICGNYVGEAAGGESNYTEQVDATAVRVVLRLGALNDMQFRSTDVSVAFLNADLSETDTERGILCRAPSIFVDAGVCQKGEVWLIRKALYGLRQSPKCWGIHRDKYLRTMVSMDTDGNKYTLKRAQCDACVWIIEDANKEIAGWVITYVDDILAVAYEKVGTAVIGTIRKQWTCSEEEVLSAEHPEMQFLG